MRVIVRAMSGLLIMIATCGMLAFAGWHLHSSIASTGGKRHAPARERSYAVDTGELRRTSVAPTITAYGQVQAWKTLEIRATVQGPITDISPNFRDGLGVEAGELLFRIDPETAERRVVDAKAAVAQAQSDFAEAVAALEHLKSEVATAEAQVVVRQGDLARKATLHAKKLVISSAYDEARLALSTAQQAVTAKKQALLAGRSRVEMGERNVERAQVAVADAEQALTETSYRAPFAGRLTEVAATLGRRVSQNEKLAVLIDPEALEVSFRVRSNELARILASSTGRKLAPLPITATLDLHERKVVFSGELDRPAAVADPNQGGRTVFAKLNGMGEAVLRPGDFVTVSVLEPRLEGVAVLPAQAATNDGRILVVGPDNRLREVAANILRRQDTTLIVDGVPFGERFVQMRLPYLAAGVKVAPRGQTSPDTTPVASGPRTASTDMVALSKERRDALMGHVRASTRMPAARKEQALQALVGNEAPRSLIERLERQIARNGGRS